MRRPATARRGAAAFALGAAMAAGQAPLGLWWLTLPALAGVLALAARAPGPRAAAWLGLAAGTGHFAAALNWIVEPFLIDIARHGWMAPFAVVLLSAGLALFWAAALGLGHRLAAGWRRPLAMALALVAAEMLRGRVLTGFPWAMPGHVLIDTPLAQLAAVAGAGGLTALVALAAAAPVAAGWRGAAVAAAGLAAAWAWGAAQLAQTMPAGPGPVIRLVQPNAAQQAKWDPDRAHLFLDRQLAYTAAAPRPDLIVWPETAVPWLMNGNPALLERIAAAGRGAPVALGIQRTEGARGFNSLAVLDPGGAVRAVYDKHHLVPFGEYMPAGDLAYGLFGIAALAAQQGAGYSPGPGARVLDLGGTLGRVLPLICYEAVFPQDLRAAPERADWILQVTNDAWFGRWTGPFQHLAQARLRAVEQGLPLIRVANTGVSAVIDARGRVLRALPLGEAGFLDAALPAALSAPPYARRGDGPLVLLLAGLGLGLAVRRRVQPLDAGGRGH